MTLCNENYFSPENCMAYLSNSQVKDFLSCESMAMAKLRGEYATEKTTALLCGSYVDAYFSGELDLFKAQNPEIFTQKGTLKSDYVKAEYIIQRIERDPLMMKYLSGRKQVCMTGMIQGVPFKIKIDVLHDDVIVDQKIMRDMKPIWVPDVGRVSFVEAWGYDMGGAIYTEVERQNRGDFAEPLPFVLAVATKEPEPDIALLSISQRQMDIKMVELCAALPRIMTVKSGQAEPVRCEACDWCRSTKLLTGVVDYNMIGGDGDE